MASRLSSTTGGLVPAVLTARVNLLCMQKGLRQIVIGPFQFRSTNGGTIVMSKEMADYSAIRLYITSK